MGEPASQIQDSQTEDLASQLENLLGEVPSASGGDEEASEAAAPAVSEPASSANPASGPTSAPASTTSPAPAPTASGVAATPAAATPSRPAPEPAASQENGKPASKGEPSAGPRFIQGGEESSVELDAQVAQMLGDAISKVKEIREEVDSVQPSEAEEAAPAPAIEESGEAGVAKAEPQVEIPASPAPAAKVEEPVQRAIQEEAPAPRSGFGPRKADTESSAPAAASPAPVAPTMPMPAAAAPQQTASPLEEQPPAPKRGSLWALLGKLALAALKFIGRLLMLAARPLAVVFAKPVEKQAPMVRDSIGWIAIVTVFMGACMWAAALLRDPKPFVPDAPPTTVLTQEGHGEGGHGEGGHGGAAAVAPGKREPLIQRGAAKKPAKKPESGHGGH